MCLKLTSNRTVAVLVMALAAACGNKGGTVLETTHPRYSPGQVWSYKTRPSEEQSRLTILRVDKTQRAGLIVHVRLDGVSIKSPSAPGGVATWVEHLPFAPESIDASVLTMERVGPVPDFRSGYDTWRSAFDDGKAGIWTGSVSDTVSAMDSVLQGSK